MKKPTIISIALIMLFCIGCGTKTEEAVEQPTTMIVNPLTEVSQEEMVQETGIDLKCIEGVDDAKYFVLNPSSSSGQKIAQVVFNIDDFEITYRAQATTELEAYDMNGLYYTWDVEKDVKVGYCDAKLMKCKDVAGMYWIDIVPGINYSLSCIGDIDEEQMTELAGLLFVPAQGE